MYPQSVKTWVNLGQNPLQVVRTTCSGTWTHATHTLISVCMAVYTYAAVLHAAMTSHHSKLLRSMHASSLTSLHFLNCKSLHGDR